MDFSLKFCISFAVGLIVSHIFYKNLIKKKNSKADPEVPRLDAKINTDLIPEINAGAEPIVEVEKPQVVNVEPEKITELKQLLRECTSDGWDAIRESENLQVYKKITESSPIAIIKARLLLPESCVDDAFFAIWDGEFRREWDSVAKDFQVISKASEDADIIYFYAASPMPSIVSNREFLQHRRYVRENGAVYIVYWSADMPEKPVPENWIRANTILSGYSITQTENGVLVEFISQNDIKGKIPPKLINALAPNKALEWAKKFTKACSILKNRRQGDE